MMEELKEILIEFIKRNEKSSPWNNNSNKNNIEIIRGKKIQFTYEFIFRESSFYILHENLAKKSTKYGMMIFLQDVSKKNHEFITDYFQ